MQLSRQYTCWSLRCSWSITCRRCSNNIFIVDLTPDFNGLGRDNWKTKREPLKFWDLLCHIFYSNFEKTFEPDVFNVSCQTAFQWSYRNSLMTCNHRVWCLQATNHYLVQYWTKPHKHHIGGLVQDCSISIANTLEILQSCIKPWIWSQTLSWLNGMELGLFNSLRLSDAYMRW